MKGDNLYRWQTDYWTEQYPGASLPRITNERNYKQDINFWLRSSAFVRLRTLELAYTLPDVVSELIGLGTARVYASAHNLFTFSAIKYVDPENTGLASHPQTRIVNVGIRVSNL